MKTIRRISTLSAFKVGAVLSALLFGVFGFFLILIPGIFGASFLGAIFGDSNAFGAGFLMSLVWYAVLIVIYAIIGGIIGAIDAFLYNIVASWMGGLQIELSESAL
ncbi:MAG: DUF3566 domain-containing protein [Ardenticatenaceae bacterium]